jgi:hypothetical protein
MRESDERIYLRVQQAFCQLAIDAKLFCQIVGGYFIFSCFAKIIWMPS